MDKTKDILYTAAEQSDFTPGEGAKKAPTRPRQSDKNGYRDMSLSTKLDTYLLTTKNINSMKTNVSNSVNNVMNNAVSTQKLLVVKQSFGRWYVHFKGVHPNENCGCPCKSPTSAMRYMLMMKAKHNALISENCFARLQHEAKRIRQAEETMKAAATAQTEGEQTQLPIAEAATTPTTPEKPKRTRKPSMMKQYEEMKRKHPDAILLFRNGDFYEMYSDDAEAAAEILNLTPTRRANGKKGYVTLAGFPHHALDNYLPKLVRAGKRVAICEQLEDPKAKNVKRTA